MTDFNLLPRLGVGLSYRPELDEVLLARAGEIDFVEVITERFFHAHQRRGLELLQRRVPIVCHGLDLCVGSFDPIEETYLEALRDVAIRVQPVWFSDHLATTRVGGIDFEQLAPVAFTEENLVSVCTKVARAKAEVDRAFLLENITYYFEMPGSMMSEAEFLTRVVEQADCGLLLDVNNLAINASNHGYDPERFLRLIPLERVVEVHVAGGAKQGTLRVDTHGHPVSDDVWRLLEIVCRRAPVHGIVLEREQNMPSFDELLDEIRHARDVLAGAAVVH
ncbi:MAG: DUF692 domain-containing protein [Chloroflexi bacterium]|nr:DUF692 domain-containing protein [Chloroflexota bacterium]